MSDDIKEMLSKLSPEEYDTFLQILSEMEDNNGSSDTLQQLYDEDYEEIPVSIDEFIENPKYAGNFTGNGSLIYPYWRQKLREIFETNGRNYSEIALTGCLSGDTIVPLLSGKKVSMEELASIGNLDEYVYSYDVETNKYVAGHLVKAFPTGVKSVYAITLDNGEVVKATANHRFMTRDKHWKSIDNGLTAGDSMMPFETYINDRGYEVIKHPQKDGSYIEEQTYRMSMFSKIHRFKGVVHHKDFNKSNNDPRNLLNTTWIRHTCYHRKHVNDLINYNEDMQKKAHDARWSKPGEKEKARDQILRLNANHPNKINLLKRVSKEKLISELSRYYNTNNLRSPLSLGLSEAGYACLLREYNINPNDYCKKSKCEKFDKRLSMSLVFLSRVLSEYHVLSDELKRNYCPNSVMKVSTIVIDYFRGDIDDFLNVICNDYSVDISQEERLKCISLIKNDIENTVRTREERSSKGSQRRDFRSKTSLYKALNVANYAISNYGYLSEETYNQAYSILRKPCTPGYKSAISMFSSIDEFISSATSYNHKIVSIEYIGEQEVYDLTVERYHNFALESGIVAHNSIG